jgi:hypothetical protein
VTSFEAIAAWLHEAVPAAVRRTTLCAGCAVVLGMPVMATPASAEPRGVVELFTSQGCSSCPPADKLLGELAKDPSLVALSLPIDYWDYLGWKDTLADSRFSARQKAYSAVRGDRDVYTPQMIVNGVRHVLGSDRKGIDAALEKSRGDVMSVPVRLSRKDHYLNVSVAAAAGHHAEVWICAVSKAVPITINRGENSDHQIVYHNVVRNVLKVGDWDGTANTWSVPLENIAREGVDAVAAYVQDGSRDRPGPMLGAAYTSLAN